MDCNYAKFVLGCAQLGMKYGITNKSSQPSAEENSKILNAAIENNMIFFDTAMDYGNSESVIGDFLTKKNAHNRVSIITKLSSSKKFIGNCPRERIFEIILAKVKNSCSRLNINKIDYLLLHDFDDINCMDGEIWKSLNILVEQGLIGSLGVSVQNEKELDYALEISEIKIIQMPFNILDTRWDKLIKKIKYAKSMRKLIIHTRSVFLQGLLLSNDEYLWKKANVIHGKEIVSLLADLLKKTDYDSMAEFCINYVRSQDWVDGIVLGVNEESELTENLKFFNNKIPESKFFDKLLENLPNFDNLTLNPSCWKVNE